MLAIGSLLAALAIGILVYALWPRRTETVYSDDNSLDGITSYYQRTYRGWYARWDRQWAYTGGKKVGPRTVGNIMLGVVAGVFGISAFIVGPFIALVFAGAALALPWLILGLQKNKREQVITSQLVDFLDGVRSALETSTLNDAVRIAAKQVDAPLSHELQTLIDDLDVRVDLSTALRNLAERNPSRSMAFMCATLDIANQTGSSQISHSLGELSKLIRENERTAQDIKNKTLILRVSGKLFVIVPSIVLLFSFSSFGVEPWTQPLGIVALIFIIGVALGSYFGFSKLQKWQTGGLS